VANLGWGVDLSFFRSFPYNPEWFFSLRDRPMGTFKTAGGCEPQNHPANSCYLTRSFEWYRVAAAMFAWSMGSRWLIDKTKAINSWDVVSDYFPHSAGTLVI